MKKNTVLSESTATNADQLLSEVKRLILDKPKRYFQGHWLYRRGDLGMRFRGLKTPSCGTVGCVGYWVLRLKSRNVNIHNIANSAQEILGITKDQAYELFRAGALAPVTIADPQTSEYAQAGAKHIAAFQKQYAKQLKAKKV